jgi:Domain of Unknown Function (DUF1080)
VGEAAWRIKPGGIDSPAAWQCNRFMTGRLKWRLALVAATGIAVVAAWAVAEERLLPGATEQWQPVPPEVAPRETDATPPAGALMLFAGQDLSEWVNSNDKRPASWIVRDGVITVHKPSGNIETRRRFRNYRLHLEWRVPEGITGEGQARGNSGVFLASTGPDGGGYEVQILDAWRNPTYVNGQAGAIYKQHVPLANPARPPGQWNVYDITWTAPVFAAGGKLGSPARVTVLFNGVLVQDDVALTGETRYIGKPSYSAHGPAPIKLQAHGDPSEPISFRNIWLVELP